MPLSMRTFRVAVGSVILITHFLSILIIVRYTYKSYEPAQIITFISAIGPIIGLYSYQYWKYITFAREELVSEIGRVISAASWITQISVIGIFCLAVIFVPIYVFTDGTEADLPAYLAIIETFFGIFIVRSFSVLFPIEVLGEHLEEASGPR